MFLTRQIAALLPNTKILVTLALAASTITALPAESPFAAPEQSFSQFSPDKPYTTIGNLGVQLIFDVRGFSDGSAGKNPVQNADSPKARPGMDKKWRGCGKASILDDESLSI